MTRLTYRRVSPLRFHLGLPLSLLLFLFPSFVSAQAADTTRIAELERRLDAVTRELERMQLGAEVVRADTSTRGMGFGASKVYRIDQGVSVGGYGEVLYENFNANLEDGTAAETPDRFDALRAILYVGYKFSDRVLFNSEIEIEHAKEAFLEFAYLDVLLTQRIGLRGGVLLAPLGLINELHEPPTYLGTERPITESRIIPTTWRENGIGLFGSTEALEWRVYLMNSFDGGGFTGSGFRGGRQKAGKALAEDLGVAARVDYVNTPGLILGGSAYVGETAQNRELNGREVGGRVTIWDLHMDYAFRGWELRALLAGASVNDASSLSELNALPEEDGIGESMLGWYLQAGYDILRSKDTTHRVIPFLRYERVNTQREVAPGFGSNPANDLTATSFGVAWKPVPEVVWKLGYQIHSNEANTGLNQWNVQIGWLF